MKPNNAYYEYAHRCRQRLDLPIVLQGDEENPDSSIEDHLADEEDQNDESEDLFNLETGWARREVAEAVGDAECLRLDPVAPGGEGKTVVVEAAVDHRGPRKPLMPA